MGLAVRNTKKKDTLFLELVLKCIKYIPVYKEIWLHYLLPTKILHTNETRTHESKHNYLFSDTLYLPFTVYCTVFDVFTPKIDVGFQRITPNGKWYSWNRIWREIPGFGIQELCVKLAGESPNRYRSPPDFSDIILCLGSELFRPRDQANMMRQAYTPRAYPTLSQNQADFQEYKGRSLLERKLPRKSRTWCLVPWIYWEISPPGHLFPLHAQKSCTSLRRLLKQGFFYGPGSKNLGSLNQRSWTTLP